MTGSLCRHTAAIRVHEEVALSVTLLVCKVARETEVLDKWRNPVFPTAVLLKPERSCRRDRLAILLQGAAIFFCYIQCTGQKKEKCRRDAGNYHAVFYSQAGRGIFNHVLSLVIPQCKIKTLTLVPGVKCCIFVRQHEAGYLRASSESSPWWFQIYEGSPSAWRQHLATSTHNSVQKNERTIQTKVGEVDINMLLKKKISRCTYYRNIYLNVF